VKTNKLQKEYTKNGRIIQLCLPIETDIQIPVDESVRLLDQILEEMDYTKLYLAYSSQGRNPVVSPKTLFKIITYAYSQKIYSSREIERACRLNLAFRWLLQNEPIPDHNTINRFRKDRLSQCMEDLLTQQVEELSELGEIDFENLFVDGTKIEANANKYSFVWRKAVDKFEARLREKVKEFLEEKLEKAELPDFIPTEELRLIKATWEQEATRQGLVFVKGIGKRKEPLQKDIEQIDEYIKRQEKYDLYQKEFRGRNSFSKIDSDATFMRMKEDYMKNGQLKPGYNVQIGVESEYIVGVDISSERSDMGTLIPFMNRMEKNYGKTFENLIADAGYESEENYQYLETKKITSYIKPSNYEYSKTKQFQRAMEFRLSMMYQDEDDSYICKNGRKLKLRNTKTRTSKSGFQSKSKVYECESCQDCPHLGKCYKGKYNKTIQVAEQFDEYRAKSLENITSEKGTQLRVNRSIQVEGVFGVTKQDYGFRRFLTRGEVNVRTEYLLLAFGFNINKLHHRIQSERIGEPLFAIEIAS